MTKLIIDEFSNLPISPQKRWLLRHREQHRVNVHNYKTSVKGRATAKLSRSKNKEKVNAYSRNWKEKHPENVKRSNDNYFEKLYADPTRYQKFRERRNAYERSRPDLIASKKARRERELGFVILWQPIEEIDNLDYHHIDKIHVIAIPHELHKSIAHNVKTGKNMDRINQLAFDWAMTYIFENYNQFQNADS
jgi:hypothetical protein